MHTKNCTTLLASEFREQRLKTEEPLPTHSPGGCNQLRCSLTSPTGTFFEISSHQRVRARVFKNTPKQILYREMRCRVRAAGDERLLLRIITKHEECVKSSCKLREISVELNNSLRKYISIYLCKTLKNICSGFSLVGRAAQ